MEMQKIERGADFDLFSATAGCQSINAKRKASDDECRAYARWLALKAGTVEAVTNSPKLEWKMIDRNNRICMGAYFGEAFVPFPGADDNGAVTFELLDDSGDVVSAGTIYAKPNGALNIAAADATAMKESGKAWAKANKGKAKAAPVVTPIAEPAPVATLPDELDALQTPQDDAPATTLADEPEIAPQDEKNGLADDIESEPGAIAALIARMDALEASLASIQGAEINNPPSVRICEPLPVQSKPQRTVAHVRAIMAYLAMRALRGELASERKHNAIGMQQLDAMRHNRDTCRLDAMDLRDKWHREQDKRRRAVLKARDLQTRLYAEHKLVNKYLEKAQERNQKLAVTERELSSLKAKIADPANPARESDMLLIKGNAEAWQAKAIAAIAEGERLKRLAVQNGGHIETLASRLARAETILRESGAMPVIHLVPPSMSVAA